MLHDATEAYIGDMVAPLKNMIPAFSTLEKQLARTIFKKYGLPEELDIMVKEADYRILIDEKREIFDKDKQLLWEMEADVKPLGVQLQLLEAYKAKAVYYLGLVYRFGEYDK
jgi:5'-deoxynucleotidase YfbR-like HD superfamily hydrolase